MKCEQNYCIYNKAQACDLDEVELNQSGMCESCELVRISDRVIERYKKKRLTEIAQIWADYDK